MSALKLVGTDPNGIPQYEHVGRYITGYYGCSCHPFASWKDCDQAHRQKLKVGQVVEGRCHGRVGIVDQDTCRQGFCLVKYGPLQSDIHQEHVANLVPSSIQLAIF